MVKSIKHEAYRPNADQKIPPKPKDEQAPKRPMSAYFLYAGDNRQKIRAKNPELKIGQIAKKLGAEWRSLNAKAKKKYVDQAGQAMEEYKEKVAEHRESAYYKRFRRNLAEWNDEWKFAAEQQKEDKKAAKSKKRKSSIKKKRPSMKKRKSTN